MKKLFLILLLVGCNEPKPTTPQYQVADWSELNKLITEIEINDINNCIKDKSTCDRSTQEGLAFVKSMEKIRPSAK